MSSVEMKFFPIDDKLGYLQVTVALDKEDHESLGDVDESLCIMSSLQSLYTTAVLNFGGEERVNELLAETLKEQTRLDDIPEAEFEDVTDKEDNGSED